MFGNGYPSVFGHRGELVDALVKAGHEVIAAFPNSFLGTGEEDAAKYGCKFIDIHLSRRGTNLKEELSLLCRYYRLIKKEKPNVVLSYTAKCDIYGGIAARMAHIPFMPNVTGRGTQLTKDGIMKKIMLCLYRIALKKAHIVFFQNQNDREFFASNKIPIPKSKVLPGSGVNLKKFHAIDYPEVLPVKFLFNSRLINSKGIEQYIDAAHYIKERYPDTEFHVCGFHEEDGRGGDYRKILEAEAERGTVVFHSHVNNMMDYYKMCHCVVLPSYHPEGIPNVMLEAAACARPIITTRHPGCIETVDDGVTGFLVEKRSSKDLATKIELFLSMTNEQRRVMGISGRQKMEREFDRQIVIDAYMKEINGLI